MKKRDIVVYIIFILTFTISFFIDKQFLSFVALIKNPFFDIIMEWITHFGSVFVILIIMTSLFLWEERKREWIPTLWASFLTAILLCVLLKLIIARPRPTSEVIYPLFNLLIYSFPSLHATVSFAAIPILDKEFPMFKLFWILFAVLVAFSRVYFEFHYLSDVIGGALLGYFIGWLFVYLEEKHKIFKKLKWKSRS